MFFHTFAAPNAASHRFPSSFYNALISPWSPLLHTLPSPQRSPTGTMFSNFPADPALPIYTTRGSLAATNSNENWLDAGSLRCKKQMGVSGRNPLCDDRSSVIVTWRPGVLMVTAPLHHHGYIHTMTRGGCNKENRTDRQTDGSWRFSTRQETERCKQLDKIQEHRKQQMNGQTNEQNKEQKIRHQQEHKEKERQKNLYRN